MAEERRYFWLKFKEDFFRSKRIKKLRREPGGDTYLIIYLKMQLLSLRNGGKLTYSQLEDSFAEELALDLDEKLEDVQFTISYLSKCGLLETEDNITYFMPFVLENLGSETAAAQRSREYRAKKEVLQCNNNATTLQQHCTKNEQKPNVDIDIDIELDKDIDLDNIYSSEQLNCIEAEISPTFIELPLNDKSEFKVTEEMVSQYQELYPAVDVKQALRNMKGWLLGNPAKRKTRRGITKFITTWLSREQDKGGTRQIKGPYKASDVLSDMGL